MKKMPILFLSLCLVFSQSLFATVNVGFVDVQKVLTTIKEGKAVITSLEKSFNAKKDIIKKDQDKITKMTEDLKKQAAVLSEQARIAKERERQEEIIKVETKAQEFEREMRKMENDLKKPIIEKLRPVIIEVSKSASVSMTFERGSSPIIYAESEKDLTDDVIKAYDKKYPGK
jgi:outer membrane protein